MRDNGRLVQTQSFSLSWVSKGYRFKLAKSETLGVLSMPKYRIEED